MKDNKLIAEFMGGQRVLPNEDFYCMPTHNNLCYAVSELQYHASWDWLMPVVEKIESDERYDVEILQYGTRIIERTKTDWIEVVNNIADISFDSKIDHTYDAIVKFIKDCEEKKVIVKDLHGLDDDTISKIETPMFLIGDWFEDETTFADLRNSKGQVVRIFHERLEDYEKKSLIDSLDS